jgi:hypothetical protein
MRLNLRSVQILETTARWNPNLIVLGLRHIDEALRTETTWAKAYEIVGQG